jgi:hypothetical protein
MVQFWLDYLPDLFNTQNFTFLNNNPETENYTKVLNLVSLLAIIIGISITIITKKPIFFALTVVVLSLCILINSSTVSKFSSTIDTNVSNTYDTGIKLVRNVERDPLKMNNTIMVNNALNFNKGDIIALSVNGNIRETNIISGINYSTNPETMGIPVVSLLNNLKENYPANRTAILKVSDTSPNIIPPPDANISIQQANGNYISDPKVMAVQNYPPFELENSNRHDWNLELATMGPVGMENSYTYQGQPYGNLKCRESSLNNPMASLEVPEYDAPPTMYGTCNEGELNQQGVLNDTAMTRNQEATVSQRVDDLLFHRGNSQWHYSPVSVDTLPNDQEAFSHFCYRNPTNLVNPKYASIFVNDPEKLKLVTRLARATGTENGGGGGGH